MRAAHGAHSRMFGFFGGVPRLVIPDNLKSGVQRANFYGPELNRSYGRMAEHYGVGILPARPLTDLRRFDQLRGAIPLK